MANIKKKLKKKVKGIKKSVTKGVKGMSPAKIKDKLKKYSRELRKAKSKKKKKEKGVVMQVLAGDGDENNATMTPIEASETDMYTTTLQTYTNPDIEVRFKNAARPEFFQDWYENYANMLLKKKLFHERRRAERYETASQYLKQRDTREGNLIKEVQSLRAHIRTAEHASRTAEDETQRRAFIDKRRVTIKRKFDSFKHTRKVYFFASMWIFAMCVVYAAMRRFFRN